MRDHPTITIIGGTPAQTGDFPFMVSVIKASSSVDGFNYEKMKIRLLF